MNTSQIPTSAVDVSSAPNGLKRLKALDGLRGVAILMVVFWHYYACVPRPAWLANIPMAETLAGYTWSGVPLFFVLSGFLIGRILIAHRGMEGYYKTFYFRRFFRLYPLYALFLALFATARFTLPLAEHTALEGLLGTPPPYWPYPLFVQNFAMAQEGIFGGHWLGVTWSLAVEEQFYLVLPVIIASVRPACVPPLMGGFVVFGFLFRFLLLQYQLAHPTALIVLLPGRIDSFALGILAGFSFTHQFPTNWLKWIAPTAVFVCITILECDELLAGTSIHLVRLAAIYTCISIIFALVIGHVRRSPEGRFSRCLSLKPLVWMGSVSYFVYLFHQPANHLSHYAVSGLAPNLATASALTLTLTAFALVLLGGEVSRRYLEEPIIRLGRRWLYVAKKPRVEAIPKSA